MKINMKKYDLETGMLVQFRNGKVYMTLNEIFATHNGHMSLSSYDENLLSTNSYGESNWDIMRASKKQEGYELKPEYWTADQLSKTLLWERKRMFEKGDQVASDNGRVVLVTKDVQSCESSFEGTVISFTKDYVSGANVGDHSESWSVRSFYKY